jgi:hypothetical protein
MFNVEKFVHVKIRFALQLIGICITDGVMPFDPQTFATKEATPFGDPSMQNNQEGPIDIGNEVTISRELNKLSEHITMVRTSPAVSIHGIQGRLSASLDSLFRMSIVRNNLFI